MCPMCHYAGLVEDFSFKSDQQPTSGCALLILIGAAGIPPNLNAGQQVLA